MATEPERSKEHPSTYIVQDRSNEEEFTRLQIQDKLLNVGMGGVLSEQEDLSRFKRILDVGCGTGGWLISLAQQVPTASLLVGVDVSLRMVQYARSQAQAAGVANRVEFQVMDALRMLEFPRKDLDLVNQRLGMGYLRTWDWPGLLQEYQRVTKPGGIIRITEGNASVGNAPAFNTLSQLFTTAMANAGNFFFPEEDGITRSMESMMRQAGLLDVQACLHALVYPAGTPEGERFAEDVKHTYRTFIPFLRKWTNFPNNYESIYQEMIREMQQPGFTAIWRLLTVWGTNPAKTERPIYDSH